MSLPDILIALLVVSIWGMNFVVIKIGLNDLPPILFSALRFIFAALPMVLFVRRPKTRLGWIAAYGMLQFALQFTLLFCGIKLGLPAGLASLVIQLQAFFTIGLAVLMLGERPRAAQLVGALIAFSGMALVAVHLEGQASIVGFVLVVLAGMCWACANIVTKKIGSESRTSTAFVRILRRQKKAFITWLIRTMDATWSPVRQFMLPWCGCEPDQVKNTD